MPPACPTIYRQSEGCWQVQCPPDLIANVKSGFFSTTTLAPVTQVFTSLGTSTTEGPSETTAIPSSSEKSLDLGTSLAVSFGLILLFCFLYFLLHKYNTTWAENLKVFLLMTLFFLLIAWWYKPIKLAIQKCRTTAPVSVDIEDFQNTLTVFERFRSIFQNFQARRAERRREAELYRQSELLRNELRRETRLKEKQLADRQVWEAKERAHK